MNTCPISTATWGHGGTACCSFDSALYSSLSVENRQWLRKSILAVRQQANEKRQQLLKILRKKTFKPVSTWTRIIWSNAFSFVEYGELGIIHVDFWCYQWLPSTPFGLLFAIIFLGSYCFLHMIIWILTVWINLPHCFCCSHHISDAERKWLSDAVSGRDDLSSDSIDKFIVSEMEKIAEKLSDSHPSSVFNFFKYECSWSGEDGSCLTRDIFEIRQGVKQIQGAAPLKVFFYVSLEILILVWLFILADTKISMIYFYSNIILYCYFN